MVIDLNLANSEYFELIFNIGFFAIVNQCQINQMLKFLFWDSSFSGNVKNQDQNFDNIHMLLIAFIFPKFVGIFFNGFNKCLKFFGSPVSDL